MMHAAFALVFSAAIVGAFAVFKHYMDNGFVWNGGIPRLAHFAAAGMLLGFFPALAGLVVAAHRINDLKVAESAAAIGSGILWMVQYAIILLVTGVGPAFTDSSYAIVSVLLAAAAARFITPKPIVQTGGRHRDYQPVYTARHLATAGAQG